MIKKNKRDEILVCAKKTLYYNNLLIAQSNSWLSEEEGMKHTEKRIKEEMKKKKNKPIHNENENNSRYCADRIVPCGGVQRS
jgi:hypothetical protein